MLLTEPTNLTVLDLSKDSVSRILLDASSVADLEMEDKNKEPNTYRLTGEGTGTGLTVSVSGSGVVTPVPRGASVTNPTSVSQGTSDPSGSF